MHTEYQAGQEDQESQRSPQGPGKNTLKSFMGTLAAPQGVRVILELDAGEFLNHSLPGQSIKIPVSLGRLIQEFIASCILCQG